MQPSDNQQSNDRSQLASGDLSGLFRRTHTYRIQHEGALTGLPGQEHDTADDPAGTGHMGLRGQIGHLDQCAIGSGLGFRAIEVAGIDAQKDYLAFLRQRCELDTDLSQPLHVDLSVFQGFVQAGPRWLEQRRERQLRKTACSCFAGQRIDQIEQGIFGFPKAPTDLVTKVVQCVPVHGRNTPDFGSYGSYIGCASAHLLRRNGHASVRRVEIDHPGPEEIAPKAD